MGKLTFNTDKMFTDITDEVQAIVPEDFQGIVNIYSPHTTYCVFQLKNELLHLVDVRFFLDKLVPFIKQPEGEQRNVKYLQDLISLRSDVQVDEAINGHSHVRSLFFNSSESISINIGKLQIGKWKELFFIKLDPMRDRELIITFIKGHN